MADQFGRMLQDVNLKNRKRAKKMITTSDDYLIEKEDAEAIIEYLKNSIKKDWEKLAIQSNFSKSEMTRFSLRFEMKLVFVCNNKKNISENLEYFYIFSIFAEY